MLDHHEARAWADHHHQFAAWVEALIEEAKIAFEALHDQRWRAPWRTCRRERTERV